MVAVSLKKKKKKKNDDQILLKKERMKLDLERESAEAKFEEEIMLELRQFLNDVGKFGEA